MEKVPMAMTCVFVLPLGRLTKEELERLVADAAKYWKDPVKYPECVQLNVQ